MLSAGRVQVFRMKIVVTLVTFIALFSCYTEGKVSEKTERDEILSAPEPDDEKKFDPQSLVGMPLKKAQKACDDRSLPHRVVEIDGEPQIVTRDFRPERLNFAIKEGVVIAVTMG